VAKIGLQPVSSYADPSDPLTEPCCDIGFSELIASNKKRKSVNLFRRRIDWVAVGLEERERSHEPSSLVAIDEALLLSEAAQVRRGERPPNSLVVMPFVDRSSDRRLDGVAIENSVVAAK
jgi:hypothetical protein